MSNGMVDTQQHDAVRESATCNIVGYVIWAIGFITGFLFIVFCGRIEVEGLYYSTQQIWSGTRVAMVS